MQLKTRDFSLEHTLECGQFFRYEKIGEWYYLVTHGLVIKIRQEKDSLIYFSSKKIDEDFIIRLFRLDEDYNDIINKISKDKIISSATKKYRGLRLMRQDPWECLVSFVCSSASNIPRIKKNLNSIAASYGEKIVFDGRAFYSFPRKIRNPEALNKCGLGFRCDYVKKLFETDIDFEKIKKASYEEAKKELVKLKGVGEKVADCVLLFSLGFQQAFPVDVWMRRTMISSYFSNKEVNNKEITLFARSYFGNNAGYAQQFLYYSARKDF